MLTYNVIEHKCTVNTYLIKNNNNNLRTTTNLYI